MKHKSAEEIEFYQNRLLHGGNLHGPVFIARYNQRGYGFGSVLSGLARNFINALGRSAALVSAKKSLKRRVLEAGSNLAKDVIKEKKGLKRSLKEGAKELVSNVISDVIDSNLIGRGKKKRKKNFNDVFRKKRKLTDIFES